MQATSANQKHTVDQEDTSFYQTTQVYQQTSEPEAELAALYIMAREAVYIRIILEEMGHKQPPTPMQTDNAMADHSHQWKGATKTRHQSNGHAFPLDKRQGMPGTIQNILATRKIELRRLLDNTSSSSTSLKHTQGILNPIHGIRNSENRAE